MAFPLFPSLMPVAMDSLWFSVDIPIDEDHELQELELQQKTLVSFLLLLHFCFPVPIIFKNLYSELGWTLKYSTNSKF